MSYTTHDWELLIYTPYQNGGDWGRVYEIVLPTLQGIVRFVSSCVFKDVQRHKRAFHHVTLEGKH
jgi:hypothetical protein